MRKTVITLATVGVVGFSSALFGNAVHAETLEDIQGQRSDIKDDLSDADAKITDVLYDLEELNEQISRVEDTLKENKSQMEETKENIQTKNDDIDELDDEITGLEEDIEERFDILKQRAISYQKNGGDVDFMEVILGSSNFSELVSRFSAVSRITESDEELMAKQEEDKEKVEKKQTKAEEKLAELKDMENELEAVQETVLAQKEDKEDNKKDLKKKKSKLKDMKEDLEMEDSELASLESDVKATLEDERQEREQQLTANNSGASNESNSSSNSNNSTNSTNSTNSSNSSDSNDSNGDVTQLSDSVSNGGGNGSVIDVGKQFIGKSTYVFGAKNPSAGQFDCSGFVSWAYGQEGTSLPRNTDGLASSGTEVSKSDMQPGDLVFFDTYKKNGHVGIYMGNGQFIGSQSSTGVDIANMNSSYWSDAFNGHVRRVK